MDGQHNCKQYVLPFNAAELLGVDLASLLGEPAIDVLQIVAAAADGLDGNDADDDTVAVGNETHLKDLLN